MNKKFDNIGITLFDDVYKVKYTLALGNLESIANEILIQARQVLLINITIP